MSEIILYSTGCPKCEVLMKKLKDKTIHFVENNDTDTMLTLGIDQLPVLSVDGELLQFGDAIKWINEGGVK